MTKLIIASNAIKNFIPSIDASIIADTADRSSAQRK